MLKTNDWDLLRDLKRKMWQGFLASWAQPALVSQGSWSSLDRANFDWAFGTLKATLTAARSGAALMQICVSHMSQLFRNLLPLLNPVTRPDSTLLLCFLTDYHLFFHFEAQCRLPKAPS